MVFFIYRPYLFIYESQKETEEQGVINLASVRVDYQKYTEELLQVLYYIFSFFFVVLLIVNL